MRPALLSLVFLCACAPRTASDSSHTRGPGSGDTSEIPPEHFTGADGVRITSPANGETVDDAATVAWESGKDVAWARVFVDGSPAGAMVDAVHVHEAEVALDSGRHVLTLRGYDADKQQLSETDVSVRVLSDPAGPYVTITSPVDGSDAVNPVQFAVDGGHGVVRVDLTADDWPIGSTTPGGVVTYSFTGTGYVRHVEAKGYDEEGDVVATDDVDITPLAGTSGAPSGFDDLVLSLIDTYPTSGITYDWSDWYTGSLNDVWYQDTLVADGGDGKHCYCVGFTWELYLRAWQEWDEANGGDGNDLNGLDAGDVLDMRTVWYVEDILGDGAGLALSEYGLGDDISNFDDWQPGDFVQLWRTSNTGHSVVFLGWEYDGDGNRVGMDYYGCNGTGPGYNTEYFGSFNGALDATHMWAGRPYMPGDWK